MILFHNKALKIIDRSKNIFKLSHGEYIAPCKIEDALKSISYLEDIFVYGDSHKASLIAIVSIK